VGLPAENINEIFNAFFTTKPEGSGMGWQSAVPLSNHTVRLWATGNDGRGATFQLTLPAEMTAS
jgi:signal transduction histidine kinase